MESKIHCKVKQAKYNEVHNITIFVQNRRQKSVSFWFVAWKDKQETTNNV